ncbi:sushi domain-containing protein 3 [Clupea harengus]|uniref:Sushi domain-containing protein 3 n=1 Tax=Clupea harengus TaxID=7950 RepID=A0A6P3VXD7_CLUHA|nr:sushi domain-containing protein 3 [Clupea harengus]
MGVLWPQLLWTVCGVSVGVSSTLGASVSPILLQTTAEPTVREELPNATETTSNTDTELSCVSLLPPRRGSYYVEHGTGVSLGSVLVFWCREGYQLVGRERVSCILQTRAAKWSHPRPDCEGLPKLDDHGLRMAIVVSSVSGVVIISLTVAFVMCCMRDQQQVKKKKPQRTGRTRARQKRRNTSRRSAAWLEREPGDWEVFPPPKIFNLSQQLEPNAATGSPAYSGSTRGYENRGYHRSQDSLRRTPAGQFYSETQLYPHLVLQRAAPGSPVYLHISAPPTLKAQQRPPV